MSTAAFCEKHLASEAAFAGFITAWNRGTLPKAEWTHAAHVAVAAHMVKTEGSHAFPAMKLGILAYNTAVGTANTATSGYHETLTIFWLQQVAQAIANIDEPLAAARTAVETFGDRRDLHTGFYSFDVVKSELARREWLAPDLDA